MEWMDAQRQRYANVFRSIEPTTPLAESTRQARVPPATP